jgi:DNA end-binding protein Ku
MRPIWSGVIGFGLVNIPVRLFSPAKEEQIDLDFLHKKDKSPIRYARFCKAEEKEIDWNDIERGYEVREGRYVVLNDADFAKANARKTKAVDILHFADAEEIDPMWYEKPYYLEPDAKAKKAYLLLREALVATGKVGVATYVLRHRESLAVIRPYKDVLVLHQLRFAHEIQAPTSLDLPKAKGTAITKKEMQIAVDLIRKSTEKFKPNEHKDRYYDELMAVIRRKSKGKAVKTHGKAPKPTKSVDLMMALRRSMAHSGRRIHAR